MNNKLSINQVLGKPSWTGRVNSIHRKHPRNKVHNPYCNPGASGKKIFPVKKNPIYEKPMDTAVAIFIINRVSQREFDRHGYVNGAELETGVAVQ